MRVRLVVDVLILMLPEVELNEIDVLPDKIPVVEEIAPEPFELSVTTVPPTLFTPSAIKPLLNVVVSDTDPLELSGPATVKLLLSETDKEAKVAPLDARFVAPWFKIVALPVVFKVRFGVAVVKLPMLPLPEVKDTELVPFKVPRLVIAPLPFAFTNSTLSWTSLAKDMAPLLAVVFKFTVPDAFIGEATAIELSFETVKLTIRDAP